MCIRDREYTPDVLEFYYYMGLAYHQKEKTCLLYTSTFVSNHPLGGQDGVALGYILGKHYNGNVRYLVNDLLMNLHGLAPLCIPINKTGSQSRDFPKMVEAGFASDNHIIMFPAGLCSRRQGGEIKDLEWKKTFVTKSIETHRDVEMCIRDRGWYGQLEWLPHLYNCIQWK